MVKGLVSIIIPTLNRSQFLEETIGGVIAQTYDHWECWVVDDGSIDETAELMLNHVDRDARLHYVKRPDSCGKGANACRNYGLALSQGEFIAFCDDDDYWLPQKLELQMPVFGSHPDVGIVTGNIEYVPEDGVRSGRIIDFKACNGYIFEALLLKNQTSMITVVLKREVFDKVGLFNTSFRFSEDWEFWRRSGYYYNFFAVPEVLACVRKHNTNTTNELTNKPLEKYARYRKLTKSLLKWGKERFSKKDLNLIEFIEWKHYRIILINHCPGIKYKFLFFWKLMRFDLVEGCRFLFLLLKFELVKKSHKKY